jgi:SAM-dependent methyltransferase
MAQMAEQDSMSMDSGVDQAEHLRVWNSRRTVRSYSAVEELQPAERALVERLGDRLSGMRMLDIGIGAGRTTLHFAHRVAEYLGVDYAANMVEACRDRFPDTRPQVRFAVMDATHMPGLADGSFDLTLFSFNGVDCVPPEQREQVFREAHRVTRPGGWFAFSTHNIRYVPRLYSLKGRRGVKALAYQLYRIAQLLRYNGPPARYADMDLAVLRDGIERFSLGICYVRPETQLAQLESLGFTGVEALSMRTGATIPREELPHVTDEAWIHFLCRR